MTHPFRHELDAALARIAQLESALVESELRAPLTRRIWLRTRVPLVAGAMIACTLSAVGLSSVMIARVDDQGGEPTFIPSERDQSARASMRTQIVTVAPRGLSAWQIGDIASQKAADLNAACGGGTEPLGLNLTLDIAADGSVLHARAEGPADLARCTEHRADHWLFPPSDGPTHASVPLYFRASLASGARPVLVPPDPKSGVTENGTLSVVCAPACDAVLEDGVPLGRSPILAHPSRPGRHVIELISGTRKHTVTSYVYPQKVAEVREDLSDSAEEARGPDLPEPL